MSILDLHDQIQVTEWIKLDHEDILRDANGSGGEDRNTRYGRRILPLKPLAGRHVRMRVQDVNGVGLANLKAPGAAPTLWSPKRNLREINAELVDIDEARRWDPIDMLALKSPDPNVVTQMTRTLSDDTRDMLTRNEQRTDWMIWEALKGVLVAPYPDSAPVTYDYGIPSSHFVTFGTPWTDLANADPINDLWALGAVATTTAGQFLPWFHTSFNTHRKILLSQKVTNRLSSYGRDVMQASESDISFLLRDNSRIIPTDDGYLDENQGIGAGIHKWIPDGKIMATTANYKYAGQPIGYTADGWVLLSGGSNATQPVARQGLQAEWIYDPHSQQTKFRQASARIPVLRAPQAIAWGTAYSA